MRKSSTNIDLLCTDFDGTLYSESMSPRIPKALVEMIGKLQQKGTIWMVNTGRDRSFLMESLLEHSNGLVPDYIGVVEREVYQNHSGQFHPVEHWNARSREIHATLFERHADLMVEVASWIRSQFQAEVYEDPHSPVCLIAKSNADADKIHAYVDQLLQDHPELAWVRNDIYARFSHSQIHKGTLLGEIANQHEIHSSRIAAAGDHFNDIPMLDRQYAGHLIAPANSIGEVRKHIREQGGTLSRFDAGHGVLDGLISILEQPS